MKTRLEEEATSWREEVGDSCGKLGWWRPKIYLYLHANQKQKWLFSLSFDLIWNFVTLLWMAFYPPVFSPLLLAVKVFEILKIKVFLWNKRTQQAVKLLCVHGGSVGRENLPLKIQVKAGRNAAYGFECSWQRESRENFILSGMWVAWMENAPHSITEKSLRELHIHQAEGSQKSKQITFKGGNCYRSFFRFIPCFVFVEM